MAPALGAPLRMARPVILTPSGLPRLDDVLAAACFYATASSVSRGVFGCGVADDPAVADETASLRDRNDIAKRGHPVLQGSLTAAHPPLADVRGYGARRLPVRHR